jgi:hypothetical protein
MKTRILCLGAALVIAASPPTHAQFTTGNYLVIIVPLPGTKFRRSEDQADAVPQDQRTAARRAANARSKQVLSGQGESFARPGAREYQLQRTCPGG